MIYIELVVPLHHTRVLSCYCDCCDFTRRQCHWMIEVCNKRFDWLNNLSLVSDWTRVKGILLMKYNWMNAFWKVHNEKIECLHHRRYPLNLSKRNRFE